MSPECWLGYDVEWGKSCEQSSIILTSKISRTSEQSGLEFLNAAVLACHGFAYDRPGIISPCKEEHSTHVQQCLETYYL
jgi:hypothetical protein